MVKAIKLNVHVLLKDKNNITRALPTGFHITILALKDDPRNKITEHVKQAFKDNFQVDYDGTKATQAYNLKFLKMWGRNSVLTSCCNNKTDLDYLSQEIYSHVSTYYPDSISNDRDFSKQPELFPMTRTPELYPGLSPQHININGNPNNFEIFGIDKNDWQYKSVEVAFTLS